MGLFDFGKKTAKVETQTVTFVMALNTEVELVAIGVSGIVDGLMVGARGPMYRVVYWADSDRRSTWVYGCEIKPAKV